MFFKKYRQPIRTIHLTKSIILDILKHTVFAWEKLRFSWRKACRAVLIKAEILLTVPPTTIDLSERIKRREPTHEGTCIPASNRITRFKWYTMGEVQLFKNLAAERKTYPQDFVGLCGPETALYLIFWSLSASYKSHATWREWKEIFRGVCPCFRLVLAISSRTSISMRLKPMTFSSDFFWLGLFCSDFYLKILAGTTMP